MCQCAIYAQDLRKIVLLSAMRNICARFAQHCSYFSNVQYMRKIVLIPQCAIYAQDLHKIVLISPMRNICTRFAQDCTYFPNVQYMCKICARLYLFSNAQYMRKICTRLYFFLQCAIYVQDLCKIVVISPMRNIDVRFAQDCTYFPNAQYMCKICTRLYLFSNAQYMCKICARLYLFLQCAIYAKDLRKIVVISSMRNICARFAQDCT